MSPILACPLCSSPRAKIFARPTAYKGVRSSRWMLVGGSGCDHVEIGAKWNSGDDPEPLVAHWNATAEKMAAEVSTRRGHTPEQAAEFLDSLRHKTYSGGGFVS